MNIKKVVLKKMHYLGIMDIQIFMYLKIIIKKIIKNYKKK